VQLPVFLNSKKGTLPNLIIIGAQKCATTSLHYYLGLHPQISMSWQKELDFFVREYNWSKGIEWYKSNFSGRAMIHGESSPNYTNYPFFNGVPERMRAVVPEAKLIFVVRDPIERIISHYIHRYTSLREDKNISEALADFNNNRYVCRSKYYMQLEQYLDYFPKANILVLDFEDLYSHRQRVLQRVFRFLGVDDSFYSRKFSSIKHETRKRRRKNRAGLLLTRMPGLNVVERLSSGFRWRLEPLLYRPFSYRVERPTLNGSLRRKLINHLRDDVERLRNYTGYTFEGWCM
jgi:hypothetical protein